MICSLLRCGSLLCNPTSSEAQFAQDSNPQENTVVDRALTRLIPTTVCLVVLLLSGCGEDKSSGPPQAEFFDITGWWSAFALIDPLPSSDIVFYLTESPQGTVTGRYKLRSAGGSSEGTGTVTGTLTRPAPDVAIVDATASGTSGACEYTMTLSLLLHDVNPSGTYESSRTCSGVSTPASGVFVVIGQCSDSTCGR